MRLRGGDDFGRYRITGELGRGGLGSVLRARDNLLGREVALKMLDATAEASDEAHRRVLREARAAAAINHPNAVSVFDVGEVDGVPYLAMELIEGRTLRAFVDAPDVDVTKKLRLMLDVARALAAAHDKGVVHRDVKPENIMVRDDGVVKVLDFGIARRARGVEVLGESVAGTTVPGMLVGTPCYMAPEQVRAQPLDGRADQFAWGIVTYELVTGKLPWGSHDQPLRAIAEMTSRRPAAMTLSDLAPEVARLIERTLRLERDERFDSMQDVIAELEPALGLASSGERRPSKPSGSPPEAQSVPLPETLDAWSQSAPGPRGNAAKLPEVIGGKYKLVRPIARGGMGSVYEVEHAHTGERCALKLLDGVVASDPASIERFRLEARVSSRLKSEHIVRVLDADLAPELGGRFFIVMELLEGDTLGDVARSEPQPRSRVLAWLGDAAKGLERAHAEGIVHRDLKPSNLFLERLRDGTTRVKILDFGLAKVSGPRQVGTVKGAVLGTPQYMAPEQAEGGEVSLRADVWAIGMIAFRLLAGRDYFEAASMSEVLAELLHREVEPPSKRGLALGDAFDSWFLRSCSRAPEERFGSAQEQVESLRSALLRRGDASKPERVSWKPIAVLALLALAIGVPIWRLTNAPTPPSSSRDEERAFRSGGRVPPLVRPVDLPAPESGNESALREYRRGLQALYDASVMDATEAWRLAVKLDPDLAQGWLRLAIYTADLDLRGSREQLTKATSLRHKLSPRDRQLLTLAQDTFFAEAPNRLLLAPRFDEVAAEFPYDSELQYLMCTRFADTRPTVDGLACLKRVNLLDPGFSVVLWAMSAAALNLSLPNEAKASAERCLAQSPAAASCLQVLALSASEVGDCQGMADAARRRVAVEPKGSRGHDLLARAVASMGGRRDAVEDALRRKWALLPPEDAAVTRASDEMRVSMLFGDFSSALASARALQERVHEDDSEPLHAAISSAIISILDETEQHAAAVGEARRFWSKRAAWSDRLDISNMISRGPDGVLPIAALLCRAGWLRPEEYDALREKWLEPRRQLSIVAAIPAAYAWPTETRDEAVVAMRALLVNDSKGLGIGQEGKVAALLEQWNEAIPKLRADVRRCEATRYPMEQAQLTRWLGIAFEHAGDRSGACEAYADILARWGSAKPRSVTAAYARARMKVLRCQLP